MTDPFAPDNEWGQCQEWTRGGDGPRCKSEATHRVVFDSGGTVIMCPIHSAIRAERTGATREWLW